MSYMCGNPLTNATRMTWEGAATTAQTVIPVPGGYVPGMNDVYVGGACLSKGDYADADGLSITLAKAMALGTQWRIVCYAPTSGISFSPNAYVAKIGDTMTGNLNFSGKGLRITGNFSETLQADRLLFQTNTANSATSVGFIPLGTGPNSNLVLYGLPDASNSPILQFVCANSGTNLINSNYTGTGAALPLAISVGGLERLRFPVAGRTLVAGAVDDGINALQVNGGVKAANAYVACAVGANLYRGFIFQTGATNRWALGCNGVAESGSNVGSDFSIDRYNDAGTWLASGMTIGRTTGYVTIPGQVQINNTLNLYASGTLSPPFFMSAGSYAPNIRANNSLPGWEFVNSAGTQVALQISDAGWLNALKTFNSVGGAIGSAACAMRSSAQQGWSFADWINAPTALQVDCSDPQSAYYAIKWTRWSDRHFAAISAIQNANNSSAITFELQGTGTGWVWNFNLSQIARYDGYYCAMNAPSDYRLKTNIKDLTGSLDRMLALRPVSFRWLESGKEADGFIAHEAQLVKPTAVTGTKDGMKLDEHDEEVPNYQSVDRLELIPDLVGAVRELKAALDAALTRIVVLEGGHLA